ncbi:MAG TPA: hypothetical protein ENJ00_04395 [Phycisphaerales bacterium]|nr:hypothetical protein [Phycisphaerales bacterium]
MHRLLLPTLLVAGLAMPAAAQGFADDTIDTGATRDAGPAIAPARQTSFFASGYADLYIPARAKGSNGGDLDSYSFGAQITADIPIGDRNQLSLRLDQTSTGYGFDSFTAFGPFSSEPIDFGLDTGLTAIFSRALENQWTLSAGARVSFAGEIGSDVGDSLIYGAFLGAKYRYSEALSLGFILGVFSQLEDDLVVVPLPVVEWQIDTYWRLDAGFVDSSGRPGVRVTNQLDDQWSIGASATTGFKQFRLEDDNSAAPGGTFSDFTIPLMFVATYKPETNITFTGQVGTMLYREVELQTSGGSRIGNTELKPTLGFGLGAEISF